MLIKTENLTKTYTSEGVETHALNNVSFEIEKGEFVAIMGPSGSGKSTLLHILGFLDTPTSGKYWFADKSFEDYTDDQRAQLRNSEIGFVFQTFNLLKRTNVYDNIRLSLLYSDIPESQWDTKIREAIESVGLSHRIEHEPSQLSGGERQRVAVARALVNNPKVIFADEPTGNLDSKSGQQVMEILQNLNEKLGHTVILITHETSTAEHARRILRIKDGMLESDTKVKNHRSAKNDFKK